MTGGPAPCTIAVSDGSAVAEAGRRARQLALAIGFDAAAAEELVLVVAELATNIVKHAGSGELRLAFEQATARRGLRVEAVDQGPGIPDVEEALRDGYSSKGSLGLGLGALNRLMDELDIDSRRGPDHGTRVVCRRWLREAPGAAHTPVDIGVVSRPRAGSDANGDTFVVKRWGGSALVAVIDGVGHGARAAEASSAARQFVEKHYDLPLPLLFQGVGRACRHTRGVVMAALAVARDPLRASFGTLGNVSARLLTPSGGRGLPVQRGILGDAAAPVPAMVELDWAAGSAMVLHSDGVSDRWATGDVPWLLTDPVQDAARRLVDSFGSRDDDATVAVVRGLDRGA